MDPGTTPGPTALLGEADFVRVLARSLPADAAAAEDVAQEALVAWLSRGPERAGALRAWLASAVRKLVRLPSTAEVVEREALRAAVVRAVLALDEPYRTVILLRYYEGVPPRASAARCARGSTASTARARPGPRCSSSP
jgi:DNA-directed RNA polymerase specialized sigma24 family protein